MPARKWPQRHNKVLRKINRTAERQRRDDISIAQGGTAGNPPATGGGSSASVYCVAAGNLGWSFYPGGFIVPRLHRIVDQSGGFASAFPVPDASLDTPDGIATFAAIQVPEDGLYRATLHVARLVPQSAADVAHLWYLPTWFPAEMDGRDDTGSYVSPPTGPDDWSLWWGVALITAGGERGQPVLLDRTSSSGGTQTYGISSGSGGGTLVWQFEFGVGSDWGAWWQGDDGPHNIIGITLRFSQSFDMTGTGISLTRDLATPSGASGSGTANGTTWLTVEKIGDHVDGTAISI